MKIDVLRIVLPVLESCFKLRMHMSSGPEYDLWIVLRSGRFHLKHCVVDFFFYLVLCRGFFLILIFELQQFLIVQRRGGTGPRGIIGYCSRGD